MHAPLRIRIFLQDFYLAILLNCWQSNCNFLVVQQQQKSKVFLNWLSEKSTCKKKVRDFLAAVAGGYNERVERKKDAE